MDQEVKYLKISDLVLWTENPRDPIDENATDQDIVDRALEDKLSKWNLKKIAKDMGSRYDFSELPTVVYHDLKPVVYDGNRRIVLGKIKHGLVTISDGSEIEIPDFPKEIPCNVCKQKIALDNVFRKHSDTGSWQPLERDIFLHKFMNKEKSIFLLLNEQTGIINSNPHLNQRFVKEEIFREDILESMGFTFEKGKLYSIHNDEEGFKILADISRKIKEKDISTRHNRGKNIEILDPSSQRLIKKNKKNKPVHSNINFRQPKETIKSRKQTRRTTIKNSEIFGRKLYLQRGDVSDLYRDIVDLHQFYIKEREHLSQSFPCLIRMSFRLLCETAAKDRRAKMDNYLRKNFDTAKIGLDKDAKTTLANHNVTKESIVQLLQTGAHNYKASSNVEQTMAISLIIGAIISISHGQDN